MIQTRFIHVIFLICFMMYPFIVYFGIKSLPPGFFGLILVLLLAMRFGVLIPKERPIMLPVLIVLMGFAIATTLLESTRLLLFYPALVNFSLFTVFANSLRHEEPLLLRVVRARGVSIGDHVPRYLFRLTALWAAFFVLNGMVALWTTTMSMEIWALYNGLLSYFVVATLIGAEWLFRIQYKKRLAVRDSAVRN
jgi:uncharacterized membrane protein